MAELERDLLQMHAATNGPTSLWTVRAEKEMHDLRMKKLALDRKYGSDDLDERREALRQQFGPRSNTFSTRRTYSQAEIMRGVLGPRLRSLLKDGIEPGVIGDASSVKRKPEVRKSAGEVRSELINGKRRIVGYASVFNQFSEKMRIGNRTFRERVMPGAFDKCLRSLPDVRALVNHDPNQVLGRSLASTLQLNTDDYGLRYEIDPPNTSFANDLLVSMSRGDINQSSFGFYCNDDDFMEDGDGGLIRQIRACTVFDCSVVTYPAYTGASSGLSAEVRSGVRKLREMTGF